MRSGRRAGSTPDPKGPDPWSELDPAYAARDGKQQSPVDIENPQKADLPASHSRPLKDLTNNQSGCEPHLTLKELFATQASQS
jgi:carbonic anhydrase